MRSLLLILLIPCALKAQIVNIPDANFKNALVNEAVAIINGSGGLQDADSNDDGEIQVNEALAVTELQVQSFDISSMEGLQSFENLERLLCFNNNITEIALSQNILLDELWVNENNLNTLDVTGLPNLDWLSCSDNALTSLDVSQNLNLRILRTSRNEITAIDISNNAQLEHFWCSSNQVSALDISNNALLFNFTARDNLLLSSLNVRNGNNSNMVRMWAQDNSNLDCILVDDETASYPTCDIGNNTGWCKDASAIYSEDLTICNLGLSDFLNLQVEIFPNPAHDFIEIVSNEPTILIQIYLISGQKFIETKEKSIDISDLSDGVYIMIVSNDQNQMVYKKLIKSSR